MFVRERCRWQRLKVFKITDNLQFFTSPFQLSASDNAALVEAVSLQTDVDAEKGITDLDARYVSILVRVNMGGIHLRDAKCWSGLFWHCYKICQQDAETPIRCHREHVNT